MVGAGRKSRHDARPVRSVTDHLARGSALSEQLGQIGVDEVLSCRDALGRALGEGIDRSVDGYSLPSGTTNG